MNDLLLDLVKEQGIVNMINDYKNDLEFKDEHQIKYKKVMDDFIEIFNFTIIMDIIKDEFEDEEKFKRIITIIKRGHEMGDLHEKQNILSHIRDEFEDEVKFNRFVFNLRKHLKNKTLNQQKNTKIENNQYLITRIHDIYQLLISIFL